MTQCLQYVVAPCYVSDTTKALSFHSSYASRHPSAAVWLHRRVHVRLSGQASHQAQEAPSGFHLLLSCATWGHRQGGMCYFLKGTKRESPCCCFLFRLKLLLPFVLCAGNPAELDQRLQGVGSRRKQHRWFTQRCHQATRGGVSVCFRMYFLY